MKADTEESRLCDLIYVKSTGTGETTLCSQQAEWGEGPEGGLLGL